LGYLIATTEIPAPEWLSKNWIPQRLGKAEN
jgi:hypothetical protein